MTTTEASAFVASNVRLIASDAGGTLLNSKGEITVQTRHAVCAVLDRGIPFALASGQSRKALLAYRDQLDSRVATISHNGAIIMDGDLVVAEHLLPREIALEAVEFFLKQHLVPQLVGSDGRIYFQHANGNAGHAPPAKPWHVEAVLADVCSRGTQPVQISVFEQGPIEELYASAKDHFGDCCSIEYSPQPNGTWISVNHPNACKSHTVAELAEYLGVQLQQVMYFGDNWNDDEVFRTVGVPFVVSNAPARIRQMGHACLSNDENGPAAILRRLVGPQSDCVVEGQE